VSNVDRFVFVSVGVHTRCQDVLWVIIDATVVNLRHVGRIDIAVFFYESTWLVRKIQRLRQWPVTGLVELGCLQVLVWVIWLCVLSHKRFISLDRWLWLFDLGLRVCDLKDYFVDFLYVSHVKLILVARLAILWHLGLLGLAFDLDFVLVSVPFLLQLLFVIIFIEPE